MRQVWMTGLALSALLAGPALNWAADKSAEKGDKATTCSKHNTSVDFFDTPSEAATEAKKEGKLVLVLHISGIFEDPKLT
jgi:hypothetical protein